MFDEPVKLLLGLVTGLIFGILLQKGQVAKYPVIVGQLLLRDWTVVKIMLTAVVVGSIGVYGMAATGATELQIKPAALGGILFGGLLFGSGLALFGYCPGTSIAACGEGHRDAMVGVAGMLAGAFGYVWMYGSVRTIVGSLPDWGKVTLPEVTGTPAWAWVAGLVILGGVAMYLFERIRMRWTTQQA